MKLRQFLGIAALLWAPVLAQEPPGSVRDPVTVPPLTAEMPYDEVLQLAPADAWLIAHTTQFNRTARYQLLTKLMGPESGLSALEEALAEVIDGPAMVSLSGMPTSPQSWSITLAARTPLTREHVFGHIAKKVAPIWNASETTRRLGKIQFFEVRGLGQLMIIGPVPFFITVGVHDGLIFGSTVPGEVEAWLGGAESGDPFIESEEFARLSRGRSAPVGSLVYLDLRSLVPIAAAQLNQVLPNLAGALQIENVESLALITDRRPGPPESRDARPKRPRGGLRLAVGVNEMSMGLTRLLASTPSPPTLAGFFPSDTTVLLHGSMEKASNVADHFFAFTAAIDKVIAEEYTRERADFKEEFGFDPHTDFLANFVKEWAIGASMTTTDDTIIPLFAVRLASPGAFKAFMHRLCAAFDLEIRRTSHRGVVIEHADRRAGTFAYAMVENVLLVSPDAALIRKAVDASLDDKSLAQTTPYGSVRRQLPPRVSKLLFLDVAGLFTDGLDEAEAEELAEFPEVVRLIESGGTLGLGVTPHPRMIALEMTSNVGHPMDLADLVAMSVVSSLQRSRYLSQRTISMSNLKGILIACKVYANDHEGQWPKSLEQLVADGSLTRQLVFGNPYQPDAPGTEPFYLYNCPPEGESPDNREVVVSEPFVHGGGALVGYPDGHVAWIDSPRAEELLAKMRGKR